MKTIQIPISKNDIAVIDYQVDFIGQIGSNAGKPYASKTSDNDYYIVLTPITNINTILQFNAIRWTWDINKKNVLQPIINQIVKHYGHLLPSDFGTEDMKIDTINHMFKQLSAQGIEPYDKVFTQKTFYVSERFSWFKTSIQNENPFLTTKTFNKTILGHANAYFKRNQPERALYTFLKFNELTEYTPTNFNYEIQLNEKSQKIYDEYKLNSFQNVKDFKLLDFKSEHSKDNIKINQLLKEWYNFNES